MATGGHLSDSDIPDIYSCTVCSEHLLDRNPRFLSCFHYFCQQCLQTLNNNARVSCPTCRKVTPVPNNDVTKLTMNFPLVQVMEREQQFNMEKIKILSSPAKNQCQLCNQQKAIYKCKDCSQILCKNCTEKHNKMKSFKSHKVKVLKLCEKHTEDVSHICMKCVKALCIKCIIFYHGDHEEHVEKYEDGENKLRCKLSNISSDLKTKLDRINNYERHLVIKGKSTVTEIEQFEKERCDLVKRIAEIELKLQKLRDSQIINNQQINSCKENKRKYTSLYVNSQKLEKASADVILCEFVDLNQEVEPVRTAVSKTTASYVQSNELLSKPELVKSITSNKQYKVNDPYCIRTTDDGSVIVQDGSIFTFLDRKGDFVRNIGDLGIAWSVGTYGNDIYIVAGSNPNILIYHYKHHQLRKVYKPDIPGLYRIAVVNPDLILCTDGNFSGSVYEFNPRTGNTHTVLTGMRHPNYINVASTVNGTRYLLTLERSHSVYIYDDLWRLLHSINTPELKYPMDTAPVPGGFLVADNNSNSIMMFNYDGQLVKHVLTEKDGIDEPLGLAVSYPHLWVSTCDYIKCFKLFN